MANARTSCALVLLLSILGCGSALAKQPQLLYPKSVSGRLLETTRKIRNLNSGTAVSFAVGLSSKEKIPQPCLSYEPAKIVLKGKMSRKTFAGRPNYESIRKGDEPETYWVLHLTKSICVNGDESTPGGEEPEKNVSAIQLVLDEQQYAQYKNSIGKEVVVSGNLYHAITGHHHTRVLLKVAQIKSE